VTAEAALARDSLRLLSCLQEPCERADAGLPSVSVVSGSRISSLCNHIKHTAIREATQLVHCHTSKTLVRAVSER